ncbi:hypothetical protein D3C85_1528610 [compost metagenome]
MNKTKIVVADTKEAFIQAVEKALAVGYLPTEEYSVKDNYYIGKFSLDKDSESSVSKEAAMKAIEQPAITVIRQPARNSRKRKA